MASNSSDNQMRSSNAKWGLLIRRMPRFSRRAWLTGIGAFLTLLTRRRAAPGSQLSTTGLKIAPGGEVKLVVADNAGGSRHMIGYAVAIPQNCAADLNQNKPPSGFKADPNLYVSPEWIDKIVFVDDSESPARVEDARSRLAGTFSNDPRTIGCGFVSAKVTLLKASNVNGSWTPAPYSVDGKNQVFSIVPHGKPDSVEPSKFNPDEIWISTNEWDATRKPIQDALKMARAYLPTGSKCPKFP